MTTYVGRSDPSRMFTDIARRVERLERRNPDTSSTQKTSSAADNFPRLHLLQTLTASSGGQINWSGATIVDGAFGADFVEDDDVLDPKIQCVTPGLVAVTYYTTFSANAFDMQLEVGTFSQVHFFSSESQGSLYFTGPNGLVRGVSTPSGGTANINADLYLQYVAL